MKEYLGDAVYADFDGFGIVLTTEDGTRATNRIVLEPEVMTANEPRDLVFWIPEASECMFEYDLRYPQEPDIWCCSHPSAAHSSGDDGLDNLIGYGETQTIAYANMLDALADWQKDEDQRRYEAEQKREYDLCAPDCLEVAKGRDE